MTPELDSQSAVRQSWQAIIGLAVLALAACQTPSTSPSTTLRDSGPGAMDGGNSGGDAGTVTPDAGPPPAFDGGAGIAVISVTPPLGPVSGGTVVVLLGEGFVNGFTSQGGTVASMATSVRFGLTGCLAASNCNDMATPTTISVIDDGTIQLTVPPGAAGLSDISLTNPSGTGGCTGCFTYYNTITLTAVTSPTPPQGSTLGGTPFTLSGEGFAAGQLVLFGNAQAQNLTFSSDGTTITGTTPAGAVGAADIAVVGQDASAFLRQGWVYVAPMQVLSVSPNGSPLAGGGTATVNGVGFTLDSQVTLGTTAATTTYVSATELTIVVPAATVAGPVNVQVAGERSQAVLDNGFAYYDPTSQNLQLFGVSPQQGPVAGGTCAAGTGCLHLVGAGFPMDGSLEVGVGLNLANVNVVSPNEANVDLPAAAAPGIVSITARAPSASSSPTLPNAFAYVNPLTVTAISPDSAPASAPTGTATLTGTGFASGCTVSIGASQAAVQSVGAGGTTMVVTIPAGSTGPANVVVTCGTTGTLSYQTADLVGGFSYTAPLQILQLNPDSGAIAGNTAVNIYGDGFTSGMSFNFGNGTATGVQVLSPYYAVVRTPPGNVGFVNVVAKTTPATATLPNGFGYYDPKNSTGGASGGPMQGILNVTLLNDTQGYYGDPVPGATVSINNDQLLGTTDSNGQVTFSDPSLLKPVEITATLTGFETSSVAAVDARDVTIYMTMNVPSNGPPPQPGAPQPDATFKGTLCGFKLPPDVASNANLHPVGQVYFTYPYVYAAPPFGNAETPVIVTEDCGTWILQTGSFGSTAIYAVFGTEDSSGNFTPYLMTVMQGLQAVPGQTIEVPLVLNMHLDVSVPITVDTSAPAVGPATLGDLTNDVYAYLDLGGEGAVPLGEQSADSNTFPFQNFPEVSGESLVFLNVSYYSGNPNSASLYYTRQNGDPSAGVTVGPMLPFTNLTTPTQPGGVFTGTLGWTLGTGPQPDLEQVQVLAPDGTSDWTVILPGSADSVSIPPSSAATSFTSATGAYTWVLVTASSPRFEYDYFSYDQLGLNAWTAFTQNYGTFTLAP